MAFVAAGSYFMSRRVPRLRALLVFTSYLVISLTFLSCFLRYEDIHDDPVAFIIYSPRYIYLQSLCFLLLFGTVLVSAWELGFSFLKEKWNRPIVLSLSRLAFVPLAALLCHYYVLNTQFGHYFVKNTQRASPYYDPDARNGVIVREFFTRLAEAEQRLGSWKGIQLTADKINDWPISIDTTVASPPSTVRLSHRARVFAISLALVALVYCTRRIWIPRLPRHAPS
jgi:phosphoglycerol transferase MdoB-like AlkP superfamily enzyme